MFGQRLIYYWFFPEKKTIRIEFRFDLRFRYNLPFTHWRKSTQFRQICLFTLDSTQEIYVSSDSQESSLQTNTLIFSLQVKIVEIFTILNDNEAVKTFGHYKSESCTLPPPCFCSFWRLLVQFSYQRLIIRIDFCYDISLQKVCNFEFSILRKYHKVVRLGSSFLSANLEHWIAKKIKWKEIATDLYSRFWIFRWITFSIPAKAICSGWSI